MRRIRDSSFGPLAAIFKDPTWDILLELAFLNADNSPACVSRLGVAAGIAPTTTVRLVDRLVSQGLLRRWCDPSDRRRSFLHLTPMGLAPLTDFFARLEELEPVDRQT
jgi:DNA-binding MarR family transcriptional regulator